MANLSAFLAELAGRKWRWGESDCLLVLADWIKRVRGIDPAASWRGTYSSEREALSIIRKNGGIVTFVATALANVGIDVADGFPLPGDVALVRAPVRFLDKTITAHAGAIDVGNGEFAMLTADRGLVVAQVPFVMAWRI